MKQNWTRSELASRIGRTPEHVRKMLSGEAFPGPDLQGRLAVVLGVRLDVLTQAVIQDRWIRKYGTLPSTRGGPQPPSPVEKVWSDLTRDQQEQIVCLAR